MRNLFVLTIAIVVTIIGLVIYTEVSHREFIKDLSQFPIEKSDRQQNLSSPEFGSQSQNTEQAAKRFEDAEDETLGLQAETPDMELPAPQDNTAISLSQESGSSQVPFLTGEMMMTFPKSHREIHGTRKI